MKQYPFLLLFLLFIFSPLYGQETTERLLNEIGKVPYIECAYLGKAAKRSALCAKADSMNELVELDKKLLLMSDSSHTLKYYLFKGILRKNDSLALSVLKEHLNDSTKVFYYCGCIRENIPFNYLLLADYYSLIKSKYLTGGGFTLSGDPHAYVFPKGSKRKWKYKLKELEEVLKKFSQEQLLEKVKTYYK